MNFEQGVEVIQEVAADLDMSLPETLGYIASNMEDFPYQEVVAYRVVMVEFSKLFKIKGA